MEQVKVLVEGEKRVKILKYNNDNDIFLNCEIEVVEDQNISKDLDVFALGLVKKYEKLSIVDMESRMMKRQQENVIILSLN